VARIITIMATAASVLAGACASADPAPGSRAFSLDETVRAARTDAARRTGLAPEAIELVSAERVTWPDGSLGCPKPGMAYPQALVPGYRIRLHGAGGMLDYHAGMRGSLVLCSPDRSVDPVPEAGRF
jgi:hypothetical protein